MTDMNFETARFNMLEQQIRPWEVLDQNCLDAMEDIPREDFVDDAYKALAFCDMEIPIGHGQSMLAPKIEAKILQAIQLESGDKVLEIGTGSGYLTALMASLADHVTSLDIQAEFTNQAQERLNALGIDNVFFQTLDALNDFHTSQLYQAIVFSGSVDKVPEKFKQKLGIGGRLFIVTGQAPVMEAHLITRISEDQWADNILFETEVASLMQGEKQDCFEF